MSIRNEIPNEVKINPIFSTSYLVDGEIKEWQGDALRTFSIRTFVASKDNKTNTSILKKLVDSDDSNFMSTEYLF